MKNKILKTILSSSVLATTAIPVITTTSCAQNTGMTGEWFEDLPEIAGCPNDEYDIPTALDFELKDGANDFGGFNKSEPEWFMDELCTQAATDMGQIPDVEPSEIYRYAKFKVEFTTQGYKAVDIIKPVKIKVVTTEAKDFETDEWCTLMLHCNRGLDHLKEVYGKSSFVGLQRKILINKLEHRVRVIGENHDPLSNGKGYAALTFEFVDLISYKNKSDGKVYCSTFSWSSFRNYSTALGSTINREVLPLFPALFRNNMKTVKKTIYYTNSTAIYPLGPWDYKDISTQLFVLSSREISNSGSSDGSVYKWYSTHSSSSDRIKKDLSNDAMTYWTRTPEPAGLPAIPEKGYYINESGGVSKTSLLDTKKRALSPVFCL